VFIKNVPFSATNEDLRTCVEQFGKVIYAIICIDPVTEHSKGTAFVKFEVCSNIYFHACVVGSYSLLLIWNAGEEIYEVVGRASGMTLDGVG
jgi:RNA-binding proteins (RRM domain)